MSESIPNTPAPIGAPKGNLDNLKKAAPKETEPMVSVAEMEAAIDRALARQAKSNSAIKVDVNNGEDKRPTFVSRTDVPEEFYMEKRFRVYVSGHNFVLPHFQIKGRDVQIPTAKTLPFKNNPQSQRFGSSTTVELSAYHDTNDRRIMELFLQDDRMHRMFWTVEPGSNQLTEKQAYGQLVTKYWMANQGAPQAQVRQMMLDRGLEMKGSTLEQHRIEVATYDAEREIEAMRKRGFWANAEAAKEGLMK